MIVRGQVLRQFDVLYAGVKSKNPLTVEAIILGLGEYFTPVNSLANQKRMMRRGMRKPGRLKVRRYTDFLIDLNEYLVFLPGAKLTDKIGMMELNGILLNSMPSIWIKKAYVQGFDCKYITCKYAVNMF